MQQVPVDFTGFFATMAALSASSQTLVENLLKRHIAWLDNKHDDKRMDKRRQAIIHALAFLVGTALAWVTKIQPLHLLGVEAGMTMNALAAGVLVSFGGSLLDEGWGAIRAFKKAQQQLTTDGTRTDARGTPDRRTAGVAEPPRR
jgi:hypothetical protein